MSLVTVYTICMNVPLHMYIENSHGFSFVSFCMGGSKAALPPWSNQSNMICIDTNTACSAHHTDIPRLQIGQDIWPNSMSMCTIFKPKQIERLPDQMINLEEYEPLLPCHCKNDLLFWQLHLLPELQLWHGLRDDAMLVPCDSHLWAMWAMQPLWSTATIEIHPQYEDPCHCKNWLATLTILHVVTLGIWDWLHKTPARQLVQIPYWQSWEHPQGHYNWEFFMPWWQQVTPSQMFSD